MLKRVKGILLGLASSTVILCLFLYDWPLSNLDLALYDRALRMFWAEGTPPNEIVIAAIDSSSLQDVGAWPWPRARHAEAIERLTGDGAKAIYLDVGIFDPDRTDPMSDQRLVEATAKAGNVVYPMIFEEIEDEGEKRVVPLEPLPEIAAAAAGLAHAHLGVADDGVVRAVHLAYLTEERTYWGPSVEILRRYLELPPDGIEARGASTLKIGELDVPVGADTLTSSRPWNSLARYEMNIGFFSSAHAFTRTSVAELLEGRFPRGTFDGKIVLYGMAAPGFGDDIRTPMSSDESMPGVVIQANAIATILKRRFVRQAGLGWIAAMTLLAAIVWGWAQERWRQRRFAWLLPPLLLVLAVMNLVLMGAFHVSFPITPVASGLVLTEAALTVSGKRRERHA